MKISPLLIVAFLTLGLATADADAARRFGGGGSLGKQRAAPTQREAVAPAKPAPAAPAATPAAPAAQPGFMSRFGGLIAGLGIGALLGSLFAGNLGGMGSILLLLLAAGIAFMVYRAFAARRASGASEPAQFAAAGTAGTTRPALNIGGGVPPSPAETLRTEASPAETPQALPTPIPGFEAEPFLRVAKTSFIRLQAANDAKDLDDIRDFTTPEMFAEISMQVGDRGDAPQRTEVVSVNASLVEAVVEGDVAIASVRFTGLIREEASANPEPYDEIWHVRKSLADRKATWLIAGIQQVS